MPVHRAFGLAGLVLLLACASCATYHDQLARGQRSFELHDNDRALAILRDLEPDLNRLPMPEQAQYAYMRGMTDYRVGYKPDARHWLSLAKAYEDNSPGVLPADWKVRINETLDELNGVVYSAGTNALVTARTEDTGDADSPKDAKEHRGPGDRRDAKDPNKRDGKKNGPRDAAKDAAPKDPPKDAPKEPPAKDPPPAAKASDPAAK